MHLRELSLEKKTGNFISPQHANEETHSACGPLTIDHDLEAMLYCLTHLNLVLAEGEAIIIIMMFFNNGMSVLIWRCFEGQTTKLLCSKPHFPLGY